jgi:hypothetical protein
MARDGSPMVSRGCLLLVACVLIAGCTRNDTGQVTAQRAFHVHLCQTEWQHPDGSGPSVVEGCPQQLLASSIASSFDETFQVPANLTGLRLNVTLPLESLGTIRISLAANGTTYTLNGTGPFLTEATWGVLPSGPAKSYTIAISVCHIDHAHLDVRVAGQYPGAQLEVAAFLPVQNQDFSQGSQSTCDASWDARPSTIPI